MSTPAPIRIAAASGATTDRRPALFDIVQHDEPQYIVGDWLSEMNMTTRAAGKLNGSLDEYEHCFLEALEPALEQIQSKKIKVAANAGASDTKALHDALVSLIKEKGLSLKVAWIGGDEVIDQVRELAKKGEKLKSLTTGQDLSQWGYEPIYAQCYLGSWGIVEAFKNGADIVICGRVADASTIIACAAFHWGWARDSYHELAHAFVAGHLIECSTYVTGGNFSGFKSLPGNSANIGYPIAEITPTGEFYISKQGRDTGGIVTVETCTAQLLYEIQGPYYYHSDVVAVLDTIQMKQTETNRVFVSNVGFRKPPPTTKVGLTALGGYQAEAHYFLCGLDIEEKAAFLEMQVRAILDESKFHTLKFSTSGRCPVDPKTQEMATVDFRVFAQSRDKSALETGRFIRPIMDLVMQGYPGATFHMDPRLGQPKPYYEYWVTLLPQNMVQHVTYLPAAGVQVDIPAPTDTELFVQNQPTYETRDPVDLSAFGPTTRVPIGYIVQARSGDKSSDSNVGFFVRHADEWDWLRSILTVDKIQEILADDRNEKEIFRFELPHILAVHFLLKDHLDRGVGATSTYDFLGKNLAEYLRCKLVDVPVKFLERGKI
ncbi:hypothetical protein N7495_007185 [Penicillium taxi]|uniref:uncharacterized protein n=1 Tax=Penicillium taxi TaxID=168475 RepID=UPI0025457924|nr:uncharacterized protein N7495_007185 [Penicillium taxi]KAJ5895494.1 hypothetical protein N7495_007185 [Penicillium taxi]